MTTTLEKALIAFNILNKLGDIRMKSTATSRKLFNLKILVKPASEFFIEEEKKIIEDLGGKIMEDNTIVFSDQKEGMAKLTEGRGELLNSEWEIPIDKPVIFRDAECVQISGNEIEALQGLANFIE